MRTEKASPAAAIRPRYPVQRPLLLAAAIAAAWAGGSGAAAQEFRLASCSRGDWAKYLVSYAYPDTPQLNTKNNEVVRFVSDTGPDSVELRGLTSIAGAEMRSGDVLNKNRPYEPILGIGGAKVTVASQGKETLKVAGTAYDCVKTVRRVERPLAIERGVVGLKGTSTIWTSAQAPLGLVRMENDLVSTFSPDYSQRCLETWILSGGGYKSWTEDVETGPERDTALFGYENAGTSLTADVMSQTADFGEAERAKLEALEPLLEALRNDDLAAFKKLEADGLDARKYRFTATNSAEGNMFSAAFNMAAVASQEMTLLMAAANEGALKIAKHLVETRKIPVNEAARTTEVLGQRLTDEDPSLGRTALFYAATGDISALGPARCAAKVEVAKYLISRGADLKRPYREASGASTWFGVLDASIACQTPNNRWKGMVRALLAGGADPNSVTWATLGGIDEDRSTISTALIAAVEAGILEDVKALVEAGAKVNAETVDGRNALYEAAARAEEGAEQAAILAYLKSRGAKPGTMERTMGAAAR